MSAKQNALNSINRIAETQFFLRPVLEKALSKQTLMSESKRLMKRTTNNYYEYWIYGNMRILINAIQINIELIFHR